MKLSGEFQRNLCNLMLIKLNLALVLVLVLKCKALFFVLKTTLHVK